MGFVAWLWIPSFNNALDAVFDVSSQLWRENPTGTFHALATARGNDATERLCAKAQQLHQNGQDFAAIALCAVAFAQATQYSSERKHTTCQNIFEKLTVITSGVTVMEIFRSVESEAEKLRKAHLKCDHIWLVKTSFRLNDPPTPHNLFLSWLVAFLLNPVDGPTILLSPFAGKKLRLFDVTNAASAVLPFAVNVACILILCRPAESPQYVMDNISVFLSLVVRKGEQHELFLALDIFARLIEHKLLQPKHLDVEIFSPKYITWHLESVGSTDDHHTLLKWTLERSATDVLPFVQKGQVSLVNTGWMLVAKTRDLFFDFLSGDIAKCQDCHSLANVACILRDAALFYAEQDPDIVASIQSIMDKIEARFGDLPDHRACLSGAVTALFPQLIERKLFELIDQLSNNSSFFHICVTVLDKVPLEVDAAYFDRFQSVVKEILPRIPEREVISLHVSRNAATVGTWLWAEWVSHFFAQLPENEVRTRQSLHHFTCGYIVTISHLLVRASKLNILDNRLVAKYQRELQFVRPHLQPYLVFQKYLSSIMEELLCKSTTDLSRNDVLQLRLRLQELSPMVCDKEQVGQVSKSLENAESHLKQLHVAVDYKIKRMNRIATLLQRSHFPFDEEKYRTIQQCIAAPADVTLSNLETCMKEVTTLDTCFFGVDNEGLRFILATIVDPQVPSQLAMTIVTSCMEEAVADGQTVLSEMFTKAHQTAVQFPQNLPQRQRVDAELIKRLFDGKHAVDIDHEVRLFQTRNIQLGSIQDRLRFRTISDSSYTLFQLFSALLPPYDSSLGTVMTSGLEQGTPVANNLLALSSAQFSFLLQFAECSNVIKYAKTKLRWISLKEFRDRTLTTLRDELMTHDGVSFALVQHLQSVVTFLFNVTSYRDVQSLTGNFRNILTQEVVESLHRLQQLEPNMDAVVRIVEDGGSESTRLRSSAADVLRPGSKYVIRVHHGTALHASIVKENGDAFHFNGKSLEGDNLLQWRQCVDLTLTGSTTVKEQQQHDYLKQLSIDEMMISQLLRALCDSGHAKYQDTRFKWNLIDEGDVMKQRLQLQLKGWHRELEACCASYPPLLLMPLSLIVQALQNGFIASMKPLFPSSVFLNPDEHVLSMGHCDTLSDFVLCLRGFFIPWEGWARYQQPRPNMSLEVLRYTLSTVPQQQQSEEFTFQKLMQRILSNYILHDKRKPFAFEWLIATEQVTAFEMKMFCRRVTSFQGCRFTVFGAHFLHPLVRKVLVDYIAEHNESMNLTVTCQGYVTDFVHAKCKQAVPSPRTDSPQAAELLISALSNQQFVNETAVSVVGPSGSGKSFDLKRRFQDRAVSDVRLHTAEVENTLFEALLTLEDTFDVIVIHPSMVSLGKERGVVRSTEQTLHKLYFALLQLWLLKCYHDGQGRYIALHDDITVAVEFPDAVEGDGMAIVPFLTGLVKPENRIQLSLNDVLFRMELNDDATYLLQALRLSDAKHNARSRMRSRNVSHDASMTTFEDACALLDDGHALRNFLTCIPLEVHQAGYYVINAWIAVAASRLRLVLDSPQFGHYFNQGNFFRVVFDKVIPRLIKDATMLVQPADGIGSDSLKQLGGLLLPNSDYNLVSFPSGHFKEIEEVFAGGRRSLLRTCEKASNSLINCYYCDACDSFNEGGLISKSCLNCPSVGRKVNVTELDAFAMVFLGWSCAFEELVEMRKSLTRMHFVLIESTVFKMMLVVERMRARDALIICSESGVGKSRMLQALATIQATSALRAYKINFELNLKDSIVELAQELQLVVHQQAETLLIDFQAVGVESALNYLKRVAIVVNDTAVLRPAWNFLTRAQRSDIRALINKLVSHVRIRCPPHIQLQLPLPQHEEDEDTATVDVRDLVVRTIQSLYNGATTSPLLSNKIMVHPTFTAQTLQDKLREPLAFARKLLEAKSNLTVVVFFDELNTSDNPGIFHAVIRDRVMPDGNPVPSNVFFVGAINPSSADNRYSVLDLPKSLKYAQVEFLAPSVEERCQYINEVIAVTIAGSLAESVIEGKRIQDHLAHLVQMAHTFSEEYTKVVDKASVVSQRDIQRALRVYTIVVDLLRRCDAEQDYAEYDDKTQLRAMVTAVWYAYVERLPVQSVGFYRDDLSSQLNEYLSKVLLVVFGHDAPVNLDWIVLDTVRRIVSKSHFRIPAGIALTDILRRNVLHVLLAVMADIPRMSCAIVGPPGRGKTLAVRIVEENLKGSQFSTDFFKNDKPVDVIYLLGSDATTAAELFDVMQRAVVIEKTKWSTRVLICFDEAGLPKNQRLVLKAIHDAIDESSVTFVCLSNTPFDPANQGRMLTRFMNDASEGDILDLIVGCLGFTDIHDGASLNLAHGLALGYKRILVEAHFTAYTQRELTNLCRYLRTCCQFDGYFLQQAFGLKDLIAGIEFNNIAETLIQTKMICQQYCEGLAEATLNPGAWQYRDDLFRTPHDVVLASFARVRSKETYMRPRYKALIDWSDDLSSALPLIEAIQKQQSTVQIAHLYLSTFPSDKTPVEDTKILAQLRHFMMKGSHVIVYNGDRIMRALFDLLNINFQQIGNNEYAKLSVNGQTTRCEVHPQFQITFIMPKSMIPLLGDSRDPFMSRVEKYYIPPPTYHRPEIVKKVEEFVGEIVGRSSFAGLTKEGSIALALLHPTKDAVAPVALDDDGKIVYFANSTLLRQCSAAAIVNARHLLQHAENYIEQYFDDVAHFSLHEVRKKFLEDPSRPPLFLTTADTHGLARLMHQKGQDLVAVCSADAAQSIDEIVTFLTDSAKNANHLRLICVAVEHLSADGDTLRLLRHHVLEARRRNNEVYCTKGHLYAILVVTPTTFPVHTPAPTADPRGSFMCYHLDTVMQPSSHVFRLLRRGVSRDPHALPVDNNNNNVLVDPPPGEDHLSEIDFSFVIHEFVEQDKYNRQRLGNNNLPYYRSSTTSQEREVILNGVIQRLPILQEMLVDVARLHLTRGRLRRLLVDAANMVAAGTQKGSLTEHFANEVRQAVAKGASRAFSCIVDNFALSSLERVQDVNSLQGIIRCYVAIVGANSPPIAYVRPPRCTFNPWLHQLLSVWLRQKGGRVLQSALTFREKAVELQRMFQQDQLLEGVNHLQLPKEELHHFVADAVAVVTVCNLCAWHDDPRFLEAVCKVGEGMGVTPILFALLISYDAEIVLQLVQKSFNSNVARMLSLDENEEKNLNSGSKLLDSLYVYVSVAQHFSWNNFLSVFAIAKAAAIGCGTLKDDIPLTQFLICAFGELLFSFGVVHRHGEQKVLLALRKVTEGINFDSTVKALIVHQIVHAFQTALREEDKSYSDLLHTLCSTLLTYRETVVLDLSNIDVLNQFSASTLKHLIVVHFKSTPHPNPLQDMTMLATPILSGEDDGPYLDPEGCTPLQTAVASVCYAVYLDALGADARRSFDALCHRFTQSAALRPRGHVLALLRHAFIDVAIELFAVDLPLTARLKTVPEFIAMLDVNSPWKSVILAQLLANGTVARYLANADPTLLFGLVPADMIPYAPVWLLNPHHPWHGHARQLVDSIEELTPESFTETIRAWNCEIHEVGRIVLSTLLFVILPTSPNEAAQLVTAAASIHSQLLPENAISGMKFMICPENSLLNIFETLKVPELRQMPALTTFLESPSNQMRVKMWLLEFICLPKERRAASHWFQMHENPQAMKETPVVGDLYSNTLIHGFDCGIKLLTEGRINRPIPNASPIEMHAVAIATVSNLLISAVLTPTVVQTWTNNIVSNGAKPLVAAPANLSAQTKKYWNHLGWVLDAIASCVHSEHGNLSGVAAATPFGFQVYCGEQVRAMFLEDPAIRRQYTTHKERDAAEHAHLTALRAIKLSEQVRNRVQYTQGTEAATLLPKLPCNRFPRAQEELLQCSTDVVDWAKHCECTRFAASRAMTEFVSLQKLLPPLIELYSLLQIRFPSLLRVTDSPTVTTLRTQLQASPQLRKSLEQLERGIEAFNKLLQITDYHLQFGCLNTAVDRYDSIVTDTPLHRLTTQGGAIADDDTTGDLFKAIQFLAGARRECLEGMQFEDPSLRSMCESATHAFGDRLPFVLRWSVAHQCGIYDNNTQLRHRAMLALLQSPANCRVYSLLQFHLPLLLTPVDLETIFIPLIVIKHNEEEERLEQGEVGDVSTNLRQWLLQQCEKAKAELLPKSFRDACTQLSVVNASSTLDALENRLGASAKRATHLDLNVIPLHDWERIVAPLGPTDPLHILRHCKDNDCLTMQHLHNAITFVESSLQLDHFEVAKRLMGNQNVLLPADDDSRYLVQALLQSKLEEGLQSNTLNEYLDDLHVALSSVLLVGRNSNDYENELQGVLTEWGEGNELTAMLQSWKVHHAACAYGELLRVQHKAIQEWCCRVPPHHILYHESNQGTAKASTVDQWLEDDKINIWYHEWNDEAQVAFPNQDAAEYGTDPSIHRQNVDANQPVIAEAPPPLLRDLGGQDSTYVDVVVDDEEDEGTDRHADGNEDVQPEPQHITTPLSSTLPQTVDVITEHSSNTAAENCRSPNSLQRVAFSNRQPLQLIRRFAARYSTSSHPRKDSAASTITLRRRSLASLQPLPHLSEFMRKVESVSTLAGTPNTSFYFCNVAKVGIPKKVQRSSRYATVDGLLKNTLAPREREGVCLINAFGCVLEAAHGCNEHDWIFTQPSNDIVRIIVEMNGVDVTVAGHRDAALQAVLPIDVATVQTTMGIGRVLDPATVTLGYLVLHHSQQKYFAVIGNELIVSTQTGSSDPAVWLTTTTMKEVVVHHYPAMDILTCTAALTSCLGDMFDKKDVREVTVPVNSSIVMNKSPLFISHSKFIGEELRTMPPLKDLTSVVEKRCIVVEERFGVVLNESPNCGMQRLHVYEFETEEDKLLLYGDLVVDVAVSTSGGSPIGTFSFLRRTPLSVVQRFIEQHLRTDGEIVTKMEDPVVHTADGVAIGKGLPALYFLEHIFPRSPDVAEGECPDCYELFVSPANHFRWARLDADSQKDLTQSLSPSPFAAPVPTHLDLLLLKNLDNANDLGTPSDTLVQFLILPFPILSCVLGHLRVEVGEIANEEDLVPLQLEGLADTSFVSAVSPTTHVLFEHAGTGAVVAVPLTEGSETTWGDAARAALRTLLIPEEAFYRYAWWILPSRSKDDTNHLDMVQYSGVEQTLNEQDSAQEKDEKTIQNQLAEHRWEAAMLVTRDEILQSGQHFLFTQFKACTMRPR